MPRTVRDANLESRDARLRLRRGNRHWKGIHSGVALCYRRGKGSGTWSARILLPSGSYELKALGVADDFANADGAKVLTFKDAQRAALSFGAIERRNDGELDLELTVGNAAESYLTWFRDHRRGVTVAESAVRTHILPALGDRTVASLKSAELRAWLDSVATKPARLRTSRFAAEVNRRPAPRTADEKRARRASANRVYTVLRAILNKAFRDGLVADDTAWRKVKPFAKVDEARIRFLTDVECVRLVNACPAELRALVRAALLTGARWGELVALRASDVNLAAPSIYIGESKSGRPRHVPLNPEGRKLFAEQVTGKVGDALVFVRPDGAPWGHNHHVRTLTEACRVAKVRPAVTFHQLRHTYASHLAQAGVPLLTISKLLGHADTRITARHYAHLADKTLAAAVTHLPSFEPDRSAVVTGIPRQRAAS